MLQNPRRIPALALTVVLLAPYRGAPWPDRPEVSARVPAQTELPVACRVLEWHEDPQLRVTLIIFHHQEEKDQARLGTLLRKHAPSAVEFQTDGHAWHPATLFRLKICFGRGLLVHAAADAQLKERATFLLRFPSSHP